jgi:hypothetical protein
MADTVEADKENQPNLTAGRESQRVFRIFLLAGE